MMTLFLLGQFIGIITPVLILYYQGILFTSCQLIIMEFIQQFDKR